MPYYLGRMLRRGGYSKDWPQRFGFFKKLPPKSASNLKKRIWIQAVSVGEVLAIEPIIQKLSASEDTEIILTTTTSTGYREALKRYEHSILSVGLFPLDLSPCSALAWRRIKPDLIVLAEGELWPEHIHRAHLKSIPTLLINARLSDKTFNRLKHFPALTRWLLTKINSIYCSSQQDADRFKELGALPEASVGNLKLDVPLPETISEETRLNELKALGLGLGLRLGFKQDPPTSQPGAAPFVLIGASTWEGEESLLLKIQNQLIAEGIDCKLILVPRHAERSASLIKLLKAQPLAWNCASSKDLSDTPIKIYLSDTTGHLKECLALADLAFIGKSLDPHKGGQTPIESAGLGIPSIFGPNMSNFKSVTRELIQAGASIEVPSEAMLSTEILKLAKDPLERSAMSEAGRKWLDQNKGISALIAEAILEVLR